MFTGIIEGLGKITQIRSFGSGKRISMEADFTLENTKIGDSIAVSGACLTVVEIDQNKFKTDVSPETLNKTTLGKTFIGQRVNLERALKLDGRLDGHLVSGHIDDMGKVLKKESLGNSIIISFALKNTLSRYMIDKGSIAVDGVSLTINRCNDNNFDVSIIPHTLKMTTLGFYKIGDMVNIETDMIGKYIEKLTNKTIQDDGKTRQHGGSKKNTDNSILDMQFLHEKGFL